MAGVWQTGATWARSWAQSTPCAVMSARRRLACRRTPLPQITWRTSVAHHPTEDSCLPRIAWLHLMCDTSASFDVRHTPRPFWFR